MFCVLAKVRPTDLFTLIRISALERADSRAVRRSWRRPSDSPIHFHTKIFFSVLQHLIHHTYKDECK